MSEAADRLWERAMEAFRVARHVLPMSADAAASRAFYAAFYAVSALFASEGKAFKRHSGIERGVHRDLVKAGRWPKELGAHYSELLGLRATSDYGIVRSLSSEDAERAIRMARAILRAVAEAYPDRFTGLKEG